MRVELTMHGTMSIDKGSGKETILRRKRMDINGGVFQRNISRDEFIKGRKG